MMKTENKKNSKKNSINRREITDKREKINKNKQRQKIGASILQNSRNARKRREMKDEKHS